MMGFSWTTCFKLVKLIREISRWVLQKWNTMKNTMYIFRLITTIPLRLPVLSPPPSKITPKKFCFLCVTHAEVSLISFNSFKHFARGYMAWLSILEPSLNKGNNNDLSQNVYVTIGWIEKLLSSLLWKGGFLGVY